ncbi:MAG: DUF4145 domain-containing protein [Comamonadaceae bacterium]|nr:MAG: DUF4145 domain-containing protein [Comamonadaceae bacterium]
MAKYVAPAISLSPFTCPACGAYAQQIWAHAIYVQPHANTNYDVAPLRRCKCASCQAYSFWSKETEAQIFPRAVASPMPHPDLPENCAAVYLEARNVVGDSSKAAAALLRLCVQHLLVHLGGKGKNLDDDIAKLVKEGLAVQVKDALDICRVVGNNAVHPGEINLDDDPAMAGQLFELINFIVRETIERQKRLAEMVDRLPQGARDAIAKRDAKALNGLA